MSALTWIDDRWHCDGRGIHAGNILQLHGDEDWHAVRIESADRGRRLIAYLVVDGMEFARSVDPEFDTVRWPE